MSGASERAGYVAILGAPNAGKSTLVNALVGAKVAIVTHKVQTTRSLVRGVAIDGTTQLILVDTPGIFAPRRRLDRAMVDAAWSGAADADLIVLLVDAADWAAHGESSRSGEDTARIVEGLAEIGRPVFLVLNKVDALRRDTLLKVTADLAARYDFAETFMISALTGDGVADLKSALAARMPEGPWLYPADQLADVTEWFLAAELTREALILRLHEELPYASTVSTESFKSLKDGSLRIEQTIYVERESQRPIVLGKGGATIREIGKRAREAMAETFGRTVHLFLHVKVRGNWADDPARYREMGLEFPASPKS